MKAEQPFDGDSSHSHNPELRLWQAVVEQALRDLSGSGSTGNSSLDYSARGRALYWFRDMSGDYRFVCDMAGLCPHRMRSMALEMVRTGKKLIGTYGYSPNYEKDKARRNRKKGIT